MAIPSFTGRNKSNRFEASEKIHVFLFLVVVSRKLEQDSKGPLGWDSMRKGSQRKEAEHLLLRPCKVRSDLPFAELSAALKVRIEKAIAVHWADVARVLGLDDYDVESIDIDGHSLPDRARRAINVAKEKLGRQLTVGLFLQCVDSIDDDKLSKAVRTVLGLNKNKKN